MVLASQRDATLDPSRPAIRIEGLSEIFRVYDEVPPGIKERLTSFRGSRFHQFRALDGVSLTIQHGERVGLVGHNGSGKSTLLKCMAKILPPDEGVVEVNGRLATLLELGAGMSHELTGRENMYLNGSILGLSRAEVDASFDKIVDFAGVREFIDTPVKNYSSGMYVRLGFAIAVHVNPDILLVDEVLAVGDRNFQERSLGRMKAFAEAGKTVVLVSHDANAIAELCDRVVVLEDGHIIHDGPAEQALEVYQQRMELAAQESARREREQLRQQAIARGEEPPPELHEPDPHEQQAQDEDAGEGAGEDQAPRTTGHITIDGVDVQVLDGALQMPSGDPTAVHAEVERPLVQPGARIRATIRMTAVAQMIGAGGLYVRLQIRRPDLEQPIYDSRTSWRVQYVAPPPPGTPFACHVDLTLNALHGTYILDAEVGNAETEDVHAEAVHAAEVIVQSEPWDHGIVATNATFLMDNPEAVWQPHVVVPPVEEGGPRQHPHPLWPLGEPSPVERERDASAS